MNKIVEMKCEIRRVLGIKSTTPIYNYLKGKE